MLMGQDVWFAGVESSQSGQREHPHPSAFVPHSKNSKATGKEEDFMMWIDA